MRKLGAGLAVAVALALLAGALSMLQLQREARALEEMLHQEATSLANLQDLARLSERVMRGGRSFLLTGKTRYLQERQRAADQFEARIAALAARDDMAAHGTSLELVRALQRQAIAQMDRAISHARAGRAHAAFEHDVRAVLPAREELSGALGSLAVTKRKELDHKVREQAQVSTRVVRTTGALGGAAALLALALGLWLERAVRKGQESAARLHHLFQGTAVAMAEEDHAPLAHALDALRAQGVRDLREHLKVHPELLPQFAGLVRILEVNDAMRSLVEIPSDERMTSYEWLFVPETLETFEEALIARWEGKTSFDAETVVQTRTGRRVETMLTVSVPTDPRSQPVVATLIDISERKKAERALLESGARLRRVFDQCPVGILMSDVNGRIQYGNPAATRILGMRPEQFLERRGLDFVHPEDRERVRAWRRDLLASGETASLTCRTLPTDSAGEQTIRAHASVLREDGEVRGLVATLEDVTEHTRLEAQLRQAQKMEAVGQLAGGVAHDFNNLLTVILNAVSLLHSSPPNKQAELVNHIETAADRAATLTSQLLAFSRKQVMRQRFVDLNTLLGQLCTMLERLVGETITLETRFTPEGAPAEVDPNLIEQVVMNLVVNARDAMPRGGRITLRTESVVTDFMERTKGSAPWVHISVSDTGTGIESERLPHVFEPFYTTKGPGQGTGLGLATVYGIVEQHQGWVEIESQVGRGTSVHVYLPRASAAGVIPHADAKISASQGHETILLVEDETAVREMVRASLEQCGYRVYEAANGDAALELWRQHGDEIALLLTDLVMPGSLSGRELARLLRAENPSLKLVYMSGYDAQHVLDESTVVLVQKPFQLTVLAGVLREQLDTRRPGAAPESHTQPMSAS